MRPLVIALATTLVPVIASAQMTFSLTSPEKQYHPDQPIPFNWRLTNNTDRSVVVLQEMAGAGYDQISLKIEGPGGARTLRPASLEVAASAVLACWLNPGGSVEGRFDLAGVAETYKYKMAAGTYLVTATFEHPAARWLSLLENKDWPVCGFRSAPRKRATAQDVLDLTVKAPGFTFRLD